MVPLSSPFKINIIDFIVETNATVKVGLLWKSFKCNK